MDNEKREYAAQDVLQRLAGAGHQVRVEYVLDPDADHCGVFVVLTIDDVRVLGSNIADALHQVGRLAAALSTNGYELPGAYGGAS